MLLASIIELILNFNQMILCLTDEYAKKDSKIKVIHKKNGGVSSTRNSGIINSSGLLI